MADDVEAMKMRPRHGRLRPLDELYEEAKSGIVTGFSNAQAVLLIERIRELETERDYASRLQSDTNADGSPVDWHKAYKGEHWMLGNAIRNCEILRRDFEQLEAKLPAPTPVATPEEICVQCERPKSRHFPFPSGLHCYEDHEDQMFTPVPPVATGEGMETPTLQVQALADEYKRILFPDEEAKAEGVVLPPLDANPKNYASPGEYHRAARDERERQLAAEIAKNAELTRKLDKS